MTAARILIVAGSDSGGGAGIQADIKTVTMLGGHAMTAITALTAQNTLGVQAVMPVPADFVLAQIDSCLSDIGADAVKIGMIGSAATAHAVADVLTTLDVPIVFDPVMVATSGDVLADAETIAAFEHLIGIASLVTPNLPELAALGGREAVLAHGSHLLLKGGHGEGDRIVDELWSPTGRIAQLDGKRFDTDDTHGTGCTLASAVACRLGQGYGIAQAFEDGVRFTRIAIMTAPGLGEGHGPLGHSEVRDFWADDMVVPGVSLNQVTLGARDYAASVGFYRTLGLRQIVDSPANGYARFESNNGATLSIHVDAGPSDRGATIVYFESPRLDGWVAELTAAGLRFDQLPRNEDWLWREARLRDPAGNVICLYHAGDNRRYPPWRVTHA
ncbi:MAG: bifunctional hydroxymethylpyrimidine kinase/phosphomethylpyrimidine kinase [Pseudomonadota bacterium]